MKKTIIVFFAAFSFLLLTDILYAADIKFNGEYRVRAFYYNDTDAIDERASDAADYIDQRFLLTGSISQGITSGVVELSFTDTSPTGSTWGAGPNYYSNGYGGNITTQAIVHQAYLNVTWPAANLYAGRRAILLGHGIILNDTSDNLALHFPFDLVGIDIAYLKLGEQDSRNVGNASDLDHNAYLVNLAFKPTDTWNVGLFFVNDVQKKAPVLSPGDDTTTNVFGISGDGGVAGILGLALEYDVLNGKDGCRLAGGVCTLTSGNSVSIKGQNLLVAAYSQAGIAKIGIGYLRVTGAGAGSGDTSSNSLSGDFMGGNGIFLHDQTRFGGGVDLNTQAADLHDTTGALRALSHNFHAIKLFAKADFSDTLRGGLEIFPFVHLVDSAVNGLPDDNVGTEINLDGGWKLDKNLDLTGVLAFFQPSDVMRDVAQGAGLGDKKSVTKLGASLVYTFQ